ncbi:MAG: putative C-S lyase [Gammaproteobacteria bacterium]|nr:putative C-S lyase [Gammaproteobacteria bacterium]
MSKFDEIIERRGTHSMKWDNMQNALGVSPDQGLAMWVADMDFRPPASVQQALEAQIAHGVYGYFGDPSDANHAVQWWMQQRHQWAIETDWISHTHGLVNGTALCLQAFTQPDDGVLLLTPVYHAFARTIKAMGRQVVECPLPIIEGQYQIDMQRYEAQMTGQESMLILCSPHNPGGRVWTREELQDVIAFCQRHNLLLVSDEIHHDLVMPGHKHHVLATLDDADPAHTVTLSATTKSFNLAGGLTGQVIIADAALREKFRQTTLAYGISPNAFGMHMIPAAYSEAGAAWIDELMAYIAENQRLFNAAIDGIDGLTAMPLQSTYLSWVDLNQHPKGADEVARIIKEAAQIAANVGSTFGAGGEGFLRFNLATPRARVTDAINRLQNALG